MLKMNEKKYVSPEYVLPVYMSKAFNCPHCNAFSHQEWAQPGTSIDAWGGGTTIPKLFISVCICCEKYAIWYDQEMIYPISSNAPFPAENMPKDVKSDFTEARDIVNRSPRSARALLRLAVQKLMKHFEEKGKDLNRDIGNLVKKGLPEKMQKALDLVRVIGNNAVHPGMIDLKDDINTATSLFDIINYIINIMITSPKNVDEIYNKLPVKNKDEIKKRDSSI